MEFFRHLLFVAWCIITLGSQAFSQGPVFINPNNAAAVEATQTADVNQGNYVTQTVYGFLDFTTTIGNTVMVFSPQSAAAASPEAAKSNEITSNNVIDTKPPSQKKEEIHPTKTIVPKTEKSSSEKLTSVVQVQTKKQEMIPSSKVDVVVDKSTLNVQQPQSVMSKIQVVEGSPSSKPNIITKVEVISGPSELAKQEAIIASRVEILSSEPSSVLSSVIQIKSDEEPALIVGNNIGEPEYDFLSRQPSEVVEETYKLVNLKPSSKFILRHRPATDKKKNAATKKPGVAHPTGLVTKLGGTVVKDGTTTVIETSVIGTYISGKYAQVLQSSSKKINPTQSQRILKTAAPSLGKGNKHRQQHIEPTPAGANNPESSTSVEAVFNAQNSIKSTRKAGGSFKRFKNRHKETELSSTEDNNDQEVTAPAQPNYKKSQKNRSQSTTRGSKHNTSSTHSTTKKHGRKRTRTTTPEPSVNSEETSTAPSKKYSSARRNKQSRASNNPSQSESSSGFSRRGYKPRIQPSNADQSSATTTSLYKFKLNRTPGRWQYKTTSKPRVTIRKQNVDETPKEENVPTPASLPQEANPTSLNEVVVPQARSDDVDSLEGSESIASIVDDPSTSENKLEPPAFPVETLKVEISTPPDFGDIYYEIATIKSPYTFQVGSVKNTRYITVTSTFEKSLEPSIEPTSMKATEPLTENILAATTDYKDNNILDSSIATLPPLYLASDMETPPLETLTETFSTTQTMLKTHILPVVRHGNQTSSSTLVQTFLVTRLVTATKTLPPMEAYQFIPSRTLNEFNSRLDEAGSELHLELEFGDENDEDGGQSVRKISLPTDLDLANIGSNLDLSDDDKVKLMEAHLRSKMTPSPKQAIQPNQQQALNPEQLQQLALYRFLNPQAQGQVITTSKPVVKVETLFETFVLPVTQGHHTIQSTISKIKGTITKTDYEFGTSTIAPALPLPPIQLPQQIPQLPQQIPHLQQQIPQIPQLTPQLPQLNPYLPQPQPQLVLTSSPIVQTTSVTQTNSKVLKLTFGAKTAQTTIYSTTVVPTVVTTYITQSVPVAPTAAFPGYFPAPFPPYPYVG